MTVSLVIAAVAIMLASLAGVFAIWTGFGTWIEENISMFMFFLYELEN
jgi:hypothetical protein